jgi:hypothetical protein
VDVAIQIPDEVGRALAARSVDLTRAVLEAVAIEAYRTSAISAAQVQEMLRFGSRWRRRLSCGVPRPITNTPWMIWTRTSLHFAVPPGNDRRQ